MNADSPTYYLLARPSFLEGMARVLDLGGSLQVYNYSKDEEEADANAIYQDWLAVGEDLRFAVRQYERSFPGKTA